MSTTLLLVSLFLAVAVEAIEVDLLSSGLQKVGLAANDCAFIGGFPQNDSNFTYGNGWILMDSKYPEDDERLYNIGLAGKLNCLVISALISSETEVHSKVVLAQRMLSKSKVLHLVSTKKELIKIPSPQKYTILRSSKGKALAH